MSMLESVGLSRVRGALLGTNVRTAVVKDDDPAPRVIIGSARATEGDGTLTFAVRLSAASDLPVGVILRLSDGSAVRGHDWEAPAGPEAEPVTEVFVLPGDFTGTATVEVLDDASPEPTETFRATVVELVGGTLSGPSRVTGTILDDDPE